MNSRKHLWFSDTHLKFLTRRRMLNLILDENPHAVILTGDIVDHNLVLTSHLEFLAERVGRPIYFILGNHDFWFSDFETVKKQILSLCERYPNLHWLTNEPIIELNEKNCIIGIESWYDGRHGNSNYLRFTADWFMIKDFRQLSSMKQRFDLFQEIAKKDTDIIIHKLEEALQDYKTVYLLTHFPGYKEANRSNSFLDEEFWKPYNSNIYFGERLTEVMQNYKKRNVILLSGHTHSSITIHPSRNIECRVSSAFCDNFNYETIYI